MYGAREAEGIETEVAGRKEELPPGEVGGEHCVGVWGEGDWLPPLNWWEMVEGGKVGRGVGRRRRGCSYALRGGSFFFFCPLALVRLGVAEKVAQSQLIDADNTSLQFTLLIITWSQFLFHN